MSFTNSRGPERLTGLPDSCRQGGQDAPISASGLNPSCSGNFSHREYREKAHPKSLCYQDTQPWRVLRTCCWLYRPSQRTGHFAAPSPTPGVKKVIPSPKGNALPNPAVLSGSALNQHFSVSRIGRSLPAPVSQPDTSIIR